VECYQKYHHPRWHELRQASKWLAERVAPEELPHPFGASPYNWYEMGALTPPPDWVGDGGVIRVWDLDKAFAGDSVADPRRQPGGIAPLQSGQSPQRPGQPRSEATSMPTTGHTK
jgi:hypothetical protein